MSNTPIARISVRHKEGDAWKSYSVLTAWSTKYDGLFNVTLDKGSERYPAMGLLDALKAVASGASFEIRLQSAQRGGENRSASTRQTQSSSDEWGSDPDIPF